MRAADVMTTNICVAAPEAPIQEIAREMLDRRISGVPVVDDDDRVLGIVSEGDLVRRAELGTDRRSWWLDLVSSDRTLASDYLKTHGRTARDVMSQPAVVVEESAELAEVAQLLESKRIKRVPVVRDGRLVGIVSRADIVRALIAAGPDWARRRSPDGEIVRLGVMAELRQLPFAVAAHANVIVDDAVHVWGHVETSEQRRAILLAVESKAGGRPVVDHMVDWRIPGYI
jgi:CBS domain-containing protein